LTKYGILETDVDKDAMNKDAEDIEANIAQKQVDTEVIEDTEGKSDIAKVAEKEGLDLFKEGLKKIKLKEKCDG
jgi:hypothetical protein